MAKKKTKKPAPKKKPAKAIKHTPKKAAKKVMRSASPRSQVLPGMEQVRNRSLDRICEGISDTRADKNRLIAEEKDLMNQAVTVMQKDTVSVYRYHGVELLLVPGDVHLRVRTVKEKANADAAPAKPDEASVTADEIEEEPEADEDLVE